jgi:hypothetical protein
MDNRNKKQMEQLKHNFQGIKGRIKKGTDQMKEALKANKEFLENKTNMDKHQRPHGSGRYSGTA